MDRPDYYGAIDSGEVARRASTCVMFGHYWSDVAYNFRTSVWEQMPAGTVFCCHCKQIKEVS